MFTVIKFNNELRSDFNRQNDKLNSDFHRLEDKLDGIFKRLEDKIDKHNDKLHEIDKKYELLKKDIIDNKKNIICHQI